MNAELERLIELALADGVLTDKEKEILYKKARELGVDIDEFELILEGKLHLLKSKGSKNETILKCPSCGQVIYGLTQVCNSCGYVLGKSTVQGDNSNYLTETIHKLENLIIEVKSVPKITFGERLKVALLTYMTVGLYLVYRQIAHKKGDSFETLLAKCDKEKRQIITYYGEDNKVRKLISELDTEINNIQLSRKKASKMANLGCFGSVIIIIVFYLALFLSLKTCTNGANNNEVQRIDSLLGIERIDLAKMEASKISNSFRKEEALDNILIHEINQVINRHELDSAINMANSINSQFKRNDVADKIHIIQVNQYLEENQLEKARNKAQLINNMINRKEYLDKISNISK